MNPEGEEPNGINELICNHNQVMIVEKHLLISSLLFLISDQSVTRQACICSAQLFMLRGLPLNIPFLWIKSVVPQHWRVAMVHELVLKAHDKP